MGNQAEGTHGKTTRPVPGCGLPPRGCHPPLLLPQPGPRTAPRPPRAPRAPRPALLPGGCGQRGGPHGPHGPHADEVGGGQELWAPHLRSVCLDSRGLPGKLAGTAGCGFHLLPDSYPLARAEQSAMGAPASGVRDLN